ncbi:ABC-three component system middle component 6 [Myxococcus hansupus]|uniref:ABC-three component system middle component 6 n=1 Tax=Pseudomyxococcus hansupus TaxID=1297742 RepID=UPI0005D11E8E|nr:ABC-three component system middle component 6 [Myxococcus hansupus]
MILPTKGIRADRALLSVGADVLRLLDEPKTVSRIWDEVRSAWEMRDGASRLSFDWFVLALDLLYVLGAVEMAQGRLSRRTSRTESKRLNPASSPSEGLGT